MSAGSREDFVLVNTRLLASIGTQHPFLSEATAALARIEARLAEDDQAIIDAAILAQKLALRMARYEEAVREIAARADVADDYADFTDWAFERCRAALGDSEEAP